jgi:hypothetical protein
MTLRKRYFRPVEDKREDIRFWQIERWKRTLNDRHDGFGQRKASDKVRVKQSTKFFSFNDLQSSIMPGSKCHKCQCCPALILVSYRNVCRRCSERHYKVLRQEHRGIDYRHTTCMPDQSAQGSAVPYHIRQAATTEPCLAASADRNLDAEKKN